MAIFGNPFDGISKDPVKLPSFAEDQVDKSEGDPRDQAHARNTQGNVNPNPSAEEHESIDPGKQLESLRLRREKLKEQLEIDPDDKFAESELQTVDGLITNLEGPPIGSSWK